MHLSKVSTLRLMTASTMTLFSLFSVSNAFAATGDSLSSSPASSVSSTSSASSASSSSEAHLTTTSNTNVNLQPGMGTIIVDQKNGSGADTIGEWTLIMPTNEQKTGAAPTRSVTEAPAGNYSILIKLPTGASATIRVYRNDNFESLSERPQTTFRLGNGETMRIVIHYTITRVGLVSVQSDPSGLSFRLTGPNNLRLSGTTPASFFNVAEGQYQVKYDEIEGCHLPAAQSLKLLENSRVDFDMRVSCPFADALREELAKTQNSETGRITITSDDQTVVIQDVPQNSWFAPYIVNVAKFGILSGYKDAKGKLTGEYGPSNNVTVAELSKIAHKIAGIDTLSFEKRHPINLKAQKAWFSPFIASAEERGWTIFSSTTVNPNRPATRGEVLVTLLQALDVPLQWQTGTFFTDVTTRTAYAGAIETATSANIVEGRKDAEGNLTNDFGPSDPINRAELAKILSQMIDTYKTAGSQ